MYEFYLDTHSNRCLENQKKIHGEFGHLSSFCTYNPERFLFFVGTKFFLITYHTCLSGIGSEDKDFKIQIISQVIEKNKIFPLHKIQKSIYVNDELRKYRIQGIELRKYIEQVNFIYRDNAGKPYAITTKTDFIESICNQEEIKANYEKTKSILESDKRKNEGLLIELEELFRVNYLGLINEIEAHKSIDTLVNAINKIIK